MDPKKKYLVSISIVTAAILGVYSFLRYLGLIELPLKLYMLVMIMIPFMVFFGALIALFGSYKYRESFGQRFLLLTTFQMFTFLTIAVAAKYAIGDDAKSFILQFLFVFMVILFLQSAFLVLLGKNVKSEEEIEHENKQENNKQENLEDI